MYARSPQIIENEKYAMFLKGSKSSEIVTQLLKELVPLLLNLKVL